MSGVEDQTNALYGRCLRRASGRDAFESFGQRERGSDRTYRSSEIRSCLPDKRFPLSRLSGRSGRRGTAGRRGLRNRPWPRACDPRFRGPSPTRRRPRARRDSRRSCWGRRKIGVGRMGVSGFRGLRSRLRRQRRRVTWIVVLWANGEMSRRSSHEIRTLRVSGVVCSPSGWGEGKCDE